MGSSVSMKSFNAYYADKQALKDVNLEIPQNSIYAFIGPSGCGKTTLLRSINRLNDLIPSFSRTGTIAVGEHDVYGLRGRNAVSRLRRGIGMVFQQPNPLPMTVMQNLLLPVKEHYKDANSTMEALAAENLRKAGLYEELGDRVHKAALLLSGGQQQRLCIARALMLDPEVMLFDEPCSALDPISTFKIEDLLMEIKKEHTIIIVTHNMEQARRIADHTAFFYQGEIVEWGATRKMFMEPEQELTQKYIRGVM
ncbi:MAG: phosphate ABC transporter ATP-binding protein [Oscillospiraceae bacterium]|nr:phosphate ABC transporter ATP-binding protein [Oscillospiraceae bacterium]